MTELPLKLSVEAEAQDMDALVGIVGQLLDALTRRADAPLTIEGEARSPRADGEWPITGTYRLIVSEREGPA